MPVNPYESPPSDEDSSATRNSPERSPEARRVAGPAIGLMAISVLSIAMLLLGLALNLFLLGSGQVDGVDPVTGVSQQGQLKVRVTMGVISLLINFAILHGARQMYRLQNHQLAESMCQLALIPCCSPCLVLGIPFGIWGLIVLSDPQSKQAFKS